MLRAAARAGRATWGVTASESDADAARREGFTVTALPEALLRAARQDALVVLAVPLPAVDEVLRAVAAHHPEALLTDVVSVKTPVTEAVARLVPGARFAGGHPMSGRSASGWTASEATLFDGRAWALCVPQALPSGVEPWCESARLALQCGAHVVPVTPAEHDSAVARVSHLPHVLAAVLAAAGADGGPLPLALAAGSFRDGTRVAGSAPALVTAMCEGNGAPLLEALDDALGKLGAARGALASTGSLRATVNAGHAGRNALEAHDIAASATVTVDLRAEQASQALLGVGAAGGRVVALDGDTATAEVPAGPTS